MSRRVLVTGASRGIGRAIAYQLASDGFDVSVHCRSGRKEAEAVVAGDKMGEEAGEKLLSKVDAATQALPELLDERAIGEVYFSLMGFYASKAGVIGKTNAERIYEGLNDWTTKAMGLPQPPYLSHEMKARFGLGGKKAESRGNRGGSRGGSRGSFGMREDAGRGGRDRGDRNDRFGDRGDRNSRFGDRGDRGPRREFGGDRDDRGPRRSRSPRY